MANAIAQAMYAQCDIEGNEYLPYADEDQNVMTFPDLDEEVTPDAGDEYVHALVMLPRGSQMI